MDTNIVKDVANIYAEQIVESAVPGKPAERLGAVTAISKDEREAARKRTLEKAAEIRAKKGIKEEKKTKRWWDDDGDGKGWEEGEVSGKFKKKKVKEAKEVKKWFDDDGDGIGYEPGEVSGKFKKKKTVKEGCSNWRQDLSEVMTDTKTEKKITEKKVNNKIVINPKLDLGEAIENLGGQLLEMTEIENIESIFDDMTDSEVFLLSDRLIGEVVEEFFYECLDEGYDIGEVENALIESIELSSEILNEAKVTLGHDTQIKSDRLQKVKSAVKKVGKAVARGAGYAAGAAVRGAKAVGREFKSGYERGRGGSSSSSQSSSSSSPSSETGTKRPGLLGRIGSALKGGLKRAVAKGARAVSRGARNVARKMEGGSSTSTSSPAPKAKPIQKKEKPSDPWEGSYKKSSDTKPAPKAKAKAPAKRKRKSKLDDLLASVRSESVEINEMPYQVMGSPDGGKEKKIGKPVKSKKYADARAAELADTHKATGGKYRSQYVENVEQIDEKTLSAAETKEKERIVKSMKDKAADFEKRYPGRGKEVMYATATKMAKKMAEQALELQPKTQQNTHQKKQDQQQERTRQQEIQIIQRKLQALRSAPKGSDPSITA